jgi:hypothetical protein
VRVFDRKRNPAAAESKTCACQLVRVSKNLMADKIGPLSLLLLVIAAAVAMLPLESSMKVEWVRSSMADDRTEHELLVLLGRAEADPMTNTTDVVVAPAPERSNFPDPINYVLWINVSGFRGDYVEKSNAPFFGNLSLASASTSRMSPTSPSLNWPSLVSMATGLKPAQHGIIGETIRLPESGEIVRRPTDLSLLKGEPIWTTAKRQGVRVLVQDWPFSQIQPSENAADIHLAEFDPEASDADRLKALMDAWTSDTDEEKIRLAMVSLHDLNKVGEKHGARAPETYTAFTDFDTQMAEFFTQLEEAWPKLNRGADELWVFITTDHGMAEVETLINYEQLVSQQVQDRTVVAIDDTVAHIWLNLPDGTNQEKFLKAMDDELGRPIFWKMYTPDQMPADWDFPADGGGAGERILVLQPKYRFTDKKGSEAVFPAVEVGGPLATGGYAVKATSVMRGQAFIFKFPERADVVDLKNIYSVQLYPTVCKLLGIEPAEGADAAALELGPAEMVEE